MSTISSIPSDVITCEIFPFLSSWEDVGRASGVCKEWSQCAEPEKVKRVKEFYFGLKDWKKYYGCDVEKTPLPQNMWKILTSPCPFWSKKQVRETHMLILIPKTVKGKPLTLNTLQALIQKPRQGHATKYSYYSETVKKKIGDQSISKSYWALMTKDVVPNSLNKTYSEQQAFIEEPYAVPGALEMAIAILLHHVKSGERLYSDKPETYTRCQDEVSREWGSRVVVGSFGASGLSVIDYYDDKSYDYFGHYGLGGLRRF